MTSGADPAGGSSPLGRPTTKQALQGCGAAAVLGAAGAAICAAAMPHNVAVAAAGAGLCVLAVIGVVAIVVRRRLPRGVPAPHLAQVDGEAALFVPRWRTSMLLGRITLGVIGVTSALFAVGCWPDLWPIGVVCGAFAAYCLVPVGYAVCGRWPLGGFWLTPTRIIQDGPRLSSSAQWSDVVEVTTGPQPRIIVRSAEIRLHGGWSGRRAGAGTSLPVNFADLVVSPPTLLGEISRYGADPLARATLGGPDSLLQLQSRVLANGESDYVPNSDPASVTSWEDSSVRTRAVIAIVVGAGLVLLALAG